jgi:hypothetical protein
MRDVESFKENQAVVGLIFFKNPLAYTLPTTPQSLSRQVIVVNATDYKIVCCNEIASIRIGFK